MSPHLWTPDPNYAQLEFEYKLLLIDSKREHLGRRENRTCRFCNRSKAEGARFNKDAHVVPAAFGNKGLLTLEECDDCNALAGRFEEQDLANYLALPRAIAGIPARDSNVQYRHGQDRSFITSSGENTKLVEVQAWEGEESVKFETLEDGRLELSIIVPPYRPARVVQAFARMLVRAVDHWRLPELEHLIHWIRGSEFWTPRLYRLEFPLGFKNTMFSAIRQETSSGTIYYAIFMYGFDVFVAPFPDDRWELPAPDEMSFDFLSNYLEAPIAPVKASGSEMHDDVVPAHRQSITIRSDAGWRKVKQRSDGSEEILEDSLTDEGRATWEELGW